MPERLATPLSTMGFTRLKMPLAALALACLSVLGTTVQTRASASEISICNYAHDGDLFFIAGGHDAARNAATAGSGWNLAKEGTCMYVGRYSGEKRIAFGFAIKNAAGDLIPVMTTPYGSAFQAEGELGSFCGSRVPGNFGRARSAADGCPEKQMPVPVSFILLTEQRYGGQDVRFNVGVRAKDGRFDLAALPPKHVPLRSLPEIDPAKKVTTNICNRSTGRVQVTARAIIGRPRNVTEKLGHKRCMNLRAVPEGTEVEFYIEEEGNFGKYGEVATGQDGSFYPEQYTQGGKGSSGKPTSFSVIMLTRNGTQATVYIEGHYGPRTVGGDF